MSISFAVSFKLGSYSEFPIGAPLANRNVLAIPPPIIMLSNFDTKFFKTEILVDTLDPPIIASEGFNGFSRVLFKAEISSHNIGPKYDGIKFVIECVDE